MGRWLWLTYETKGLDTRPQTHTGFLQPHMSTYNKWKKGSQPKALMQRAVFGTPGVAAGPILISVRQPDGFSRSVITSPPPRLLAMINTQRRGRLMSNLSLAESSSN